MNYSFKKQIISNFAFVICFAFLFSTYCTITARLFNKADEISAIETNTSSSHSKRIVIDAGHGGEDGGAVGVNGALEKDLNLSLSEVLGNILIFSGYEVIQTRTEDKLLYDPNSDYRGQKKVLDLKGRLQIAQNLNPDIFIGIHMNAFPVQKYSGLSVYYSNNDPDSKLAAEIISADIKNSLQPQNTRQIKAANSSIYILNRITCPAVLVECGFLSNPEECQKLSDYEYRRELSLSFYSSLVSFLEK